MDLDATLFRFECYHHVVGVSVIAVFYEFGQGDMRLSDEPLAEFLQQRGVNFELQCWH